MQQLLCLLLVTGQALDIPVLNQFVDQALEEANVAIKQSGSNVIHIPALNYRWRVRKHLLKMSGHANCKNGYVKSLATMKRKKDVVMRYSDNQVNVKLYLGLGRLEAGFQHCQFKARHLFSMTQHIRASVRSNIIEAQATVTKNDTQCAVHLDRVKLAKLGKIKVRTGGGILHKIEDFIISKFIRKSVSHILTSELKKKVYAKFASAEQHGHTQS